MDAPEDTDPIPTLTLDFIKAIEKRFPPRCPELHWEDRYIWYYAGQRHIVDFLKSVYNRQQETRFDNVIKKT